MTYKPNHRLQKQSLLLTAALLAALYGIVAVLDLLPRPGAAVEARRAATANRAERGGTSASASQQHWRRAWTCPAGSWLEGVPAAMSNGWAVTTGKGHILGIDNSGRVLWNTALSNTFFNGSPAVAGTSVVAATFDGEVLAVDAVTGRLQWRVPVEGGFRRGPLAMRCGGAWQVVLLSAGDGALHCLDVKNGVERWQSAPVGEADGEAGFDRQFIAFGNCGAVVNIMNATNGERLTQIPVGPGVEGPNETEMPPGVMAGGILVHDGRVYSGTGGGELICADVASNAVIWRVGVSEHEAFGAPVAAGELVVMGTQEGDVAAFEARNGAKRWRVSLSNAVTALCVVDDAVFVMSGGSIIGLRAKDGGRFAGLPVGDDVAGPVWNGCVLVVADDGGGIIGVRASR